MSKTLQEDFPLPMAVVKNDKQQTKGVHSKLMAARVRLQATELKKSGLNKFAGFRYFELGDFLPAIQTIFNEVGLCGVVSYGKEEAWLTITDVDDGSSVAVCSPMAEAGMKGITPIQQLGAVQTYLRRYLWMTALELVEHDMLDATAGKKEKESFKSVPQTEWENLDEDTQQWMLNEAMAISVMIADNDVAGAVNHLESLGMDADYKVAFWSRLDSKQRSAIKKYQAEQRSKPIETEHK